MTITQQQALEALERVYYATHASFIDRNLVRQYIEQSTAQPQAVVPAPPQEFESAQGRALASAWAEGWAQCRDAEYVGEEAQDEAFNQSATLAQCLHADQTRFQGGLSNDQLRRAWSAKLPNVIPTDEQLTAFALGIESAAQPSAQAETRPNRELLGLAGGSAGLNEDFGAAQAERAPVQAVQHVCGLQGFGAIGDACPACADRASSGATPADVRMLTRDELNDVALSEQVGWGPGEYVEAVQRKFCAVNAGKRIPADGVIGGAA